MKLKFSKQQVGNATVFIRRCGYGEYYDRRMQKTSYMKRATMVQMFPRYHVYIEERGDEIVLDLHLDQKRPMYEGVSAHSGEYEGGAVEREADRIYALARQSNV